MGLAEVGAEHFLAAVNMARTDMDMLTWFRSRGFEPHRGQMQVIEALQRPDVHEVDVCAGKRGGKSRLASELTLYYVQGLARRAWSLGPTWDVVDRSFRTLYNILKNEASVVVDRQKESRLIELPSGGMLEGVSWRVPEQVEARGIHFCVSDESQYMPMVIHDKILARMVGDWKWLRIGSPAESGMSFYEDQAYTNAISKLPHYGGFYNWGTWENPDPEVQMAVQIERENLAALIKQRGEHDPVYKQRKRRFDTMYGGISVPPMDVAIGSFDRDIHARPCPYDPDLPVYLAVDPGYFPGYYAVLAFQPHPWGEMLDDTSDRKEALDKLWQIDEIYVQHHTTDQVIDLCRLKPWWQNVRYAVLDVAARQINRQTGRSDIALWGSKCKFPIKSQWVYIDDGLTAHRRWLNNNRLFHDPVHCPNTIREYALYRMRANLGDGKDIPIDRWNHALKALAYMIVQEYGVQDDPPEQVYWEREISRPSRRIWAVR